ncbi:YdcF family protein [Thioalkalivibrio thiocyanodenitrificans]|uniref:YdcF family protein n=1 Tax=Thioalkalivibrio thiocyanodenitrificans TaxID=243063 RepID=UPI0003818368|nr:YdcF family protein [Thioalkalivibrio thiocyanodenitrificans]
MPTILELLIMPPASGFILMLLGLVLWRLPLGRMLAFAGAAWLYVAATPVFAGWLLGGLERPYRIDPPVPAGAQAIVVLAGGRYAHAPEYGGGTVNAASLERLRYGARLHRRTGLPLLVSGGRVGGGEPESEARLMAGVLEDELGVSVRWHEEQGRNTMENALFSARMLRPEGIDHVLLVSHALHMPRAAWSFRRAGLTVTPFPTRRVSGDPVRMRFTDFLPQPSALWYTGQALHEYLGLAWYRLRH